jgi:hypothetical protein
MPGLQDDVAGMRRWAVVVRGRQGSRVRRAGEPPRGYGERRGGSPAGLRKKARRAGLVAAGMGVADSEELGA